MMNAVGKSYVCISKSCGFITQAQKSLWNILIAQTFEPVPLPAHIPVLLLLAKTGAELLLPSTVHPRGTSSPLLCFGQLQAAQELQPLVCTSSEALPIPDVHTTPAACALSHSSASQKNHICSGSSNIEATRGCSSMMSPLHSWVNMKKEYIISFYFFIILPGGSDKYMNPNQAFSERKLERQQWHSIFTWKERNKSKSLDTDAHPLL